MRSLSRILSLCLISSILSVPVVNAAPTFGKRGLVVSASDHASRAGVEMLEKGGNAVDAAVATAFVMAVTRPQFGSIGGGGFMLLRVDGRTYALDHRERAPGSTTADMFIKAAKAKASEEGGLAVGTPGNVKGLWEAHNRFGKLAWAELLKPAIRLADAGFLITGDLHERLKENLASFTATGRAGWSQNGKALEIGTRVKQPKLAAALRIIQKKGALGFYTGPVARDLVETVRKEGGILTAGDLAAYSVRWLTPLRADVFGHTVFTMPPPSSGGTLLISELKMAEQLHLEHAAAWSSRQYHLMGEIMRRAFFDRQYIADPSVMKIRPEELFENARVKAWAASIDPLRRTEPDWKAFEITSAGPGDSRREGKETTHYCTVDKFGNAVAATTTLNTNFGSGVWTSRYGIALNNEMDDFTTRPGEPNYFGLRQSELNVPAPFKTPLSSMSPTLVEKDGQFVLAAGGSGGPRIINAVFQAVFWSLTSRFDLDVIVQAPRVHHQFLPDTLHHEETMSPDVAGRLSEMGHKVKEESVARVQAIRRTKDGLFEGAWDARGEGGASGY